MKYYTKCGGIQFEKSGKAPREAGYSDVDCNVFRERRDFVNGTHESVNETPEIEKEAQDMSINKDDLMNGLFGDTPSKSLFGQSENEIIEIDIGLIDDLFSFEHPFAKSLKRRKGIEELADQIRQCGILQPTILRMHPNGRYEILAGHRRRLAASMAELTTIPAILKDCDDDTAKLIVTYTNLGQRDEILPSEKAKAYKMALDAIKRVAGRPSKNGTTPLHNFYEDDEENGTTPLHNFDKGDKSINIVAEKAGESRETVRKYIRLNELIEPILDRVDEKEIPLKAAVELSYLREQEQKALEEIIIQNKKLAIRITEDIAKELRGASKEMELTKPIVEAVINPPDEKSGKEKGFNSKPPKPVYKAVFRGLEKQLKELPPDRAEKLALCQKKELEQVIRDAINQYLDTF
ncbi:MAG: ParB/RepB/Spo0J family partition protein [Eubacteriales bacterium]|nr:ParB/RepB/Spo0J family partition protein [Eubacteriales bacterium]